MNETQQKNDGGSADYYQLPLGAAELQDLIEHKGMNFAVGNIFKAAYRLGAENSLSDRARDLRKIQWFAERELQRLTPRKTAADYTPLSPSEAKALADSISPPSLCGSCIRQGCPVDCAEHTTECGEYLPQGIGSEPAPSKQWTHEPEAVALSLALPSITVEGDLEEVHEKYNEEWSEWRHAEHGSLAEIIEAFDVIQVRQTLVERGGDVSRLIDNAWGWLELRYKEEPDLVVVAKRAMIVKNAARSMYAPEVCEKIVMSGGKEW